MRLTEKAIKGIDNRDSRFKLAKALDCSELTIRRYISNNEDNSDLTKLAAMEVIREELKLEDSQILEEGDTVKANSYNGQ